MCGLESNWCSSFIHSRAFSYGDRQTISLLLRKLKQQAKDQLHSRKPDMIESLKKLGDFVVDLKWDFTSWIPLVSKMLPSDICKITKKGEQDRASRPLALAIACPISSLISRLTSQIRIFQSGRCVRYRLLI